MNQLVNLLLDSALSLIESGLCFMVTLFPGMDDNGNDAVVLSSYEAYLAIKRRHRDFQLQLAARI